MKPIINNKKAILMPETLKIVLAVIGISLLVVLSVKLYSIFIGGKTESEQAKASLENLYLQIQSVEKGDKTQAKFVLESPNEWWLISWPYENEDKKPNQCKGNYCVCLCPYKFDIGEKDMSLNECDKNGICKDVSKQVLTSEGDTNTPLLIKGVLNLRVSLKNEKIIISKPKLIEGEYLHIFVKTPITSVRGNHDLTKEHLQTNSIFIEEGVDLSYLPENVINTLLEIKKDCDCSVFIVRGTEGIEEGHGSNEPVFDIRFSHPDGTLYVDLFNYIHKELGLSSDDKLEYDKVYESKDKTLEITRKKGK